MWDDGVKVESDFGAADSEAMDRVGMGLACRYLMRMRSAFSYCAMSEMMILSPTDRPRFTTTALTDALPSSTGTIVASLPSGDSFQIPALPGAVPYDGRPTDNTSFRFSISIL